MSETKWAVIGAGPAGVLAATRLKKAGEDVTLFDRTDRVGGNAQSMQLPAPGLPNRRSDLAVKFLPPCGWEERRLAHPIVEELAEFGARLVPVGRSTFYRDGQLQALPLPLNPVRKLQLAMELLRTFDVFYEASQLQGPEALYSRGYVRPGENIFEWGERMGAPLLTRLMTNVYEILGLRHYGFGDGARTHAAGYVIGLRCRYLPGTYRKVFHRNAGLRHLVRRLVARGVVKIRQRDAFIRFLDLRFPESELETDWSILPMSFGALFPRMAAERGLRLRLGQPVTDVRRVAGGRVSLRCGGGPEVFDRVLVCTPVPFLRTVLGPELREAFGMLQCGPRQSRVSVSVSRGSVRAPGLRDRNTLVFSSEHLDRLGTAAFTPALMGYINEPGGYVMAQSYSRTQTPDEVVKLQHARDLERMGAKTSSPTALRHFDWPYVPTTSMIDTGFFERLSEAQGRDHVAICNETTCGLGLLNLSNGVDRLLAKLGERSVVDDSCPSGPAGARETVAVRRPPVGH
jgi:hypothetical protein